MLTFLTDVESLYFFPINFLPPPIHIQKHQKHINKKNSSSDNNFRAYYITQSGEDQRFDKFHKPIPIEVE